MSRKSDHDQPTKRKHSSFSKGMVWMVMAMLVVGLGGFGVTNFGSSLSAIGAVGDEEITVNEYALALQQEIRALSQQTQQSLSLEQADTMSQILFGQPISDRVLGRLYATAALDGETGRIGISVGDQQVQEQVVNNPAFQDLGGKFDRESYRFALSQNGLSEREFENSIREDLARTILQGAISGGVVAPEAMTNALINYASEQRSFTWAKVDSSMLTADIPTPTAEQLQAYYNARPEDFTSEEVKKITYAWITPNMLVDQVDLDEDALRSLYEERIEDYRVPERRLVEELVFESQDAADAAHARLNSGEVTFNALVAERNLSLSDIDLGDVSADDLGAAASAVFALTEPGDYTSPQPSELGPAIYRMNGILNARETSFEDARADLVSEYAIGRARRIIEDSIQTVEDLLAEGASLEDLAAESILELGQIDWSPSAEDDIAGYESFRAAAAQVSEGDFEEITELEDGGIFALRLDETVEPTLQDFASVEDQVTEGWIALETQNALNALAETFATQITDGQSFADLGLEPRKETDLDRDSFVEETPPAFMSEIFTMSLEEVRAIPSEQAALVVQLQAVTPPDMTDPEITVLTDRVDETVSQAIAQDIFLAYIQSLQLGSKLTRDQATINAIHAQLP